MLTPRVVDTARGPVEVAEIGTGPALLVLHGMPGDWRQARTLAGDLADAHRVILPSRPGYGRTPLRAGRTPDDQAHLMVALLDGMDASRAAVVGISGGGPSARAFAAQHPGHTSALVLLCAVAPECADVPVAVRMLGGIPGLWAVASRVDRRRRARILSDPVGARRLALADLNAAERAAADEAVVADLVAFGQDRLHVMTQVAGLRNDFRQLEVGRAAGPAPWPGGVQVPTLVMHGDADTVVPVDHARHLAAHIPGARLEVLPGAGHGFLLTRRRPTSERIRRFLAEEAVA
jgi:pimeloyl-ACP methyl ester carboxylesterase